MAKKKMSEQEREKLRKMHRESDTHITVTRNGTKLIDNGKLTAFGKRKLKAKAVTKEKQWKRITKISSKEKEKLRSKLFKRDGGRCHYCGIEEGDFIEIWRGFYGEKRGKKLEVDRKDNEKGYNEENCVLSCSICNNAKSDKFTYEEFKKVGDVIKEIWQQRKKKKCSGSRQFFLS